MPKDDALLVRAIPFGPGRARGRLCHDPHLCNSDSILVIPYSHLDEVTELPAGLAVVDGAPLSHAMIDIIGQGTPAVILTREEAEALDDGREVVLDGINGIISDPAHVEDLRRIEAPRAGQPVLTRDGAEVELRASVGHVQAAETAFASGACRIGLVRTEYLAADLDHVPSAADYREALAPLLRAARSLPVTVRLPDFRPDKCPAWLPPLPGMASPLGLQGCRLYDFEPVAEALRALLEAIATFGDDYDLSLLLPYVTRRPEYRRWRREIEALLPTPMAIGVMAENPAAVMGMREWSGLADFVAIGCNDLMQCLFGADRAIASVAELADPYDPIVYRFLKQVAERDPDYAAKVQICGLLPQLPLVMPLLLGLGYRVFSVEPVFLPALARIVADTDTVIAQTAVLAACNEPNAEAVRALLGGPAPRIWGVGAIAGI